MWKKISIQLILLLIVFFSIFYVYEFYFKTKDDVKIVQSDIVQNKSSNDTNNNKSNLNVDNKTNSNNVDNKTNSNNVDNKTNSYTDNENNLIKNLSYFSKDNLGNEYIIESKYSELNLDNVDIIRMKEVSAKIIMVNSEPIYITSNFAKYNNENYETTFTDNVIIEPGYDISVTDSEDEVIELEVITINPDTGGPVQIEGFDYETGTFIELEMAIK